MKLHSTPIFDNDRCDDHPPYSWISTWGTSFFIHLAVLLVLALTLSAAPATGVPGDGQVYNDVAIALKSSVGDQTVYEAYEEPGGGGEGDNTADPAGDPASGSDFSSAAAAGIQKFLSDSPTPNIPDVGSSLPGFSPNAGSGGNGISFGGDGVGSAAGKLGSGSMNGFGRGTVGFFGTSGTGSSFTFVLDRSASMEGSPMEAAKAALVKSLGEVQSNQKFQVIFYNDRLFHLVKLRLASAPNLREAVSLVTSITADGGTNHMAALKLALNHRTDVIFFLTDADEPPMTSQELEFVRKNAVGIQINTIQFGIGPKSNSTPNFLEKLAKENGGGYTYVDVKGLR